MLFIGIDEQSPRETKSNGNIDLKFENVIKREKDEAY